MNKNLKKVISTVAALSLSASAVSAFAVNFPDVAADASYAQAVQELSALGVVSGFEDGTFRPDELVTRAQMAKFIVDALNETDQAEASKVITQFADVSADHWAKGYINQGVADTFISGYGDGNFGPDDNVTYAQAQSMLVRAIGYQTYAEGSGGWPNGYKTWAASQGITNGISGLSDDTQLTRAQVAQLVDNTMGAPVCVIKDYETTIDGRKVPNLEIKDDEGKDYQTLFTKKHDAYKVFGRVTKTSKTDNLDTDKVEFRVEKADNFDDQWIGSAKNADEETQTEEMYFGDTKAPDYLLTYAQALIQKDNNDEFHIISITAAAAAKTVTLAAEDFDDEKTNKEKTNSGAQKLYFYDPGTTRNSKKYTVDVTDPKYLVYVNGVKADEYKPFDKLVEYLADNDTAAVTLEKQSNVGSSNTSTDYNLVNITTYKTAIVSEVTAKSDRITVYFDNQEAGIGGNMKVELDDDTKTYDFTLDGEPIDPADLQEDDVLSIAWNMNGNFADSDFYDVIVSRDVVEDVQCTSSSDDDFTFDNGSTYKTTSLVADRDIKDNMTSTFVLYLDHFNRIAKLDENVANKKIAILKNIYKKAGGDWYAQIITKEGAEEEYKMDKDKATEAQISVLGIDADEAPNENGVDYGTAAGTTKVDKYPNQVIEYSVSSTSNKLTYKSTFIADGVATAEDEYKESSSKVGGLKLNDATVILDISEADDDEFDVISMSDLVDGNSYEGYGYDPTTSGTKYQRFVLLTSGVDSLNSSSQMAVIMKVESVNDDGTNKVQLKLAYDGEEATYVVDDSKVSNDAKDYNEGDAILFKVNGSGHITEIAPIFKNTGILTTYKSLFDTVEGGTSIINTEYKGKPWDIALKDGNSDEIDFVFGTVVNRNGSNVTIAMPGEYKVSDKKDANGNQVEGTVTHGVDYDAKNADYNVSGAKIYAYDFSASNSKGASKVSLDEGIMSVTKISNAQYTGVFGEPYYNHTILDLDHVDVKDDVVFAVARVDGDEVKEIYFMYQED